jgi:predicted MPP superfamily phosphohydrolase
VFVSRGLGEAGIPLRLNCLPEINLLTLTSGG